MEKKNAEDELKALIAHWVSVPRYLYKCIDLEIENKKLKEELSKLKEKYGDIDY